MAMYTFGQDIPISEMMSPIHTGPGPTSGSTPSLPSGAGLIVGIGGAMTLIVGLATIIGPALAYHGYKRNHDNILWAIVWLISGAFWPVLLPVALYQGFAQPE